MTKLRTVKAITDAGGAVAQACRDGDFHPYRYVGGALESVQEDHGAHRSFAYETAALRYAVRHGQCIAVVATPGGRTVAKELGLEVVHLD